MLDLRLTLLQRDLHWQDPAANRNMFAKDIAAHADKSDLIVLPEMFSTGFTMDAASNAEPVNGETSQWLEQLAKKYDTWLCGSLIIEDEGQYYNRLLWAEPGEALRSYDKRHLFRISDEHKNYTAGTERLTVNIGDWRIRPMICYDVRFPVWSRSVNDCDLLLYVANWPASRQSAWTTLLPARAVENLCYSAGVNRTGTDGSGIDYCGGSMIADHLGKLLAVGKDKPAAVSATLSLDKLNRYRSKFPAWKDADEFKMQQSAEQQ